MTVFWENAEDQVNEALNISDAAAELGDHETADAFWSLGVWYENLHLDLPPGDPRIFEFVL